MKKLISCLLAVLLVCSLMSMSVFADTTQRPVGNGPTPDINDGVDSFGSGNGSADVTVNFGQSTDDSTGNTTDNGSAGSIIIHKYAVDITYGELLLDLTDFALVDDNNTPDNEADDQDLFMVWDVNQYKYVLCFATENTSGTVTYTPADLDGTTDDTTDDVDSDVLTTPVLLDGTVYITNHSDLSVDTSVTIASSSEFNDIFWTIGVTDTPASDGNYDNDATPVDNTAATATATQTIDKATADNGTDDGKKTYGAQYTFEATPNNPDGWLGVIGNLMNETATVIGQITVTIAPTT